MGIKIGKYIRGGLAIAMIVALAACGTSTSNTGDSSSGGSSGGSGSLSNIGKTPNYSADHAGYLTGTHANFTCGDTCHAVPLTARTAEGEQASVMVEGDRTKICSNCHMGKWSATSILNHGQYGIGAYCNSCHYSDSFTSHNRADTSAYHTYITTSCTTCHPDRAPDWHAGAGLGSGCEDCHAYPSYKPVAHNNHSRITGSCESCHFGRQPGSHGSTRQANCARCHSYPDWANATGFDHSGINSGCDASGCHTKHYSGYDCIWCHVNADPGNAWNGWNHSRVDNRACTACHANGTGDDDGKGDRNAGFSVPWFD